jgi:hypothetical protein
VVTDDSKPVKGLPLQAFHLFEDGQEQTVKIFEEHNAADAACRRIPTATFPRPQ